MADAGGIEWIDALSLIVALGALVKTFLTDARSRRIEEADAFDRRYGDTLREALRNMDETVSRLRAYWMPTAQSLVDLQSELPALMVDIEDSTLRVARLLREISGAPGMGLTDWSNEFNTHTRSAEQLLEEAATQPYAGKQEFQDHISRASNLYYIALAIVRSHLDSAHLRLP